jgi:hypothetical protein
VHHNARRPAHFTEDANDLPGFGRQLNTEIDANLIGLLVAHRVTHYANDGPRQLGDFPGGKLGGTRGEADVAGTGRGAHTGPDGLSVRQQYLHNVGHRRLMYRTFFALSLSRGFA